MGGIYQIGLYIGGSILGPGGLKPEYYLCWQVYRLIHGWGELCLCVCVCMCVCVWGGSYSQGIFNIGFYGIQCRGLLTTKQF